jgi:diguanylate cyclase (GGDEF)-like protein/PAS domain S-box-containing protein
MFFKIIIYLFGSLFLTVTLLASANVKDSSLLSDEEKEYLKQHKTITFTGDPNWLPFEAFNENGEYIGIVADHLALLEKSYGITFNKIVSKNWKDAVNMAMQDKVSVISGDIADKKLNQHFNYIEPYIKNKIVIIMDTSNIYVDNLNELRGKKIAIIKDYGYTADIYKEYPDLDFVEVQNVQEGLLGVSNGKYKAMLASNTLASYSIQKMGLENVSIVGQVPITMSLTLFINKNEPLLFSIIEKGIKNIDKQQHKDIIAKWRKVKPILKIDYTLLWQISLLFILILLFLLYKHYISKKYIGKIKKLNERVELALSANRDAIWEINLLNWSDGYISPRWYEMLGYDKNNQIDNIFQEWKEKVHPDDFDETMQEIRKNHEGKTEFFESIHRQRHKNGHWVWIHSRGKTIFDDNGVGVKFIGTFTDVSEKKALEDEILELAHRDQLTNLYNRHYFYNVVQEIISLAKREKKPLSVMMIDIDKFKNINDTYGHKNGDIVIKSLANIMLKTIRASDIVARVGGEEFVILLPNTSSTDAVTLANKLRKNVQNHLVQFENNVNINITVSIGVASVFVEDEVTIDKALARADEALYRAKEDGRNNVQLF